MALPWIVMLAVWALVIAWVNPIGEFSINDDWSFVKILESLMSEGRIGATGWGHGGPSAIMHVLWGGLFTQFAGSSLTALRISVLVAGIVGSFGLLTLLRRTGASPALSLLGTLTLMLNPLFLSQAFTFMTDVTFATLVIFSLLCLHQGIERSSTAVVAVGLGFALCATLTRQIGIVVPTAFVLTCLAHPAGRQFGPGKALLLAVGIGLVPWAGFEFFLARVGSTPVVQHERMLNLLALPMEKGFPDYLVFLGHMFFFCGLGYLAFFLSPLLVNRYREFLSSRFFLACVGALTAGLLVVEAGIVTGLLDPPVIFWRNVLFNFGIGPILLKDTYILEIPRMRPIPVSLYYFALYWAALAFIVTIRFMISTANRIRLRGILSPERPWSFVGTIGFLAALMYLTIISLSCFHDRYLISVLLFMIVWLVADKWAGNSAATGYAGLWPGFLVVVLLGSVSTLAVGDFMEMKRSLSQAHRFLLEELKADPCHIDGGFEFNGYHCNRRHFVPVKGLSWWWVDREDYLVTLGPLPGYRIVRTFPFDRVLSNNGEIHVLQPEGQGLRSNARSEQ